MTIVAPTNSVYFHFSLSNLDIGVEVDVDVDVGNFSTVVTAGCAVECTFGRSEEGVVVPYKIKDQL